MSSSGSDARCGRVAQSASVTKGITGWSSRRYVSSTSTSVHHVASRVGASRVVIRQPDLGELQPPVAVLAPDRLVQDAGQLAERVARRRPRRPPRSWPRRATAASARHGSEVARVRQPAFGVVRDRARPGARHVAGRVPELVREVARVLELGRPEPLVVARRRAVDDREPQGVGAGLVDGAQRVYDVALRLGHLLAERVADEAGQVDRVERLGRRSARCPSIIIRATQKKMMS